MDEGTEEYIVEHSRLLYEMSGTQIVVVPVFSLYEMNLKSYVTRLFWEFGIDDREKITSF